MYDWPMRHFLANVHQGPKRHGCIVPNNFAYNNDSNSCWCFFKDNFYLLFNLLIKKTFFNQIQNYLPVMNNEIS